MEYLASGFNNVDNADDYSIYSNCLRFLDSIEFFKKYKHDSHRMLHLYDGLRVLDVGCGLGGDLINLAHSVGPKGVVTGLDSSQSLLELARSRLKDGPGNIVLKKGNALNLEFEDSSFDRCKIDRTLQHISEPQKALSEMFRVLKPGGIMLAFDNDWGTYTLSCTNRATLRNVTNYWCDSFASGWIGRYLYTYFSELGLSKVEVSPRTLILNDLETADKVFDIFQSVERCLAERLITELEAKELVDEMREQDNSNRFFCSYTGFLVVGYKL